VLPPLTKPLAEQINLDVLQGEYGESDLYFAFDHDDKLRGNTEGRYSALTSAAGRPWRTVNETRAGEDLPPIDGGDELTIPTNVMLAGDLEPGATARPLLPAPNVMPPQDPNKPAQDGSHREEPKSLVKAVDGTVNPENRVPQFSSRARADMGRQRRYINEVQNLLLRFYKRQADALGGKAFDSERWNRELSRDLEKAISSIVEREGGNYVGRLGGDDFDTRQTDHYITAMAGGAAEALNRVTQRDVEAETPRDAVDRAMHQRAAVAGGQIGARATVFARVEAAKQAPDQQFRSKTWIADTERHGDLDGVSVPLESDWGGIEPGSEPNCQCSVSVG
jgi:hypothetical protein